MSFFLPASVQLSSQINLLKLFLGSCLLIHAAVAGASDQVGSSKVKRSPENWKACRNLSRNGTLAGFRYGVNLPPECKPQVLYSWGSEDLVNKFRKIAPPGNVWIQETKTPIFFHVDPIATFAYGDVSIRIKLKEDTSFYVLDDFAGGDALGTCSNAKANQLDIQNTVFLHAWENFATAAQEATLYAGTDYILCSTNPIESWSFASVEHLNEIKSAILWVDSVSPSEWISYVSINKMPVLFSFAHLLDTTKKDESVGLDNKDWRREHLNANVELMTRLVNERKTVISIRADESYSKTQVFRNDRPTYGTK